MKIDVYYQYFFKSTQKMLEHIFEHFEFEKKKYAKNINYHFSQMTAFFGTPEEEKEFFLALRDRHESTFMSIEFAEQFDELPASHKTVRRFIIDNSDKDDYVEKWLNSFISHHHYYPLIWDGLIVLRRPIYPADALIVSAYARNRNLFLLTTLVDKKRDKEIIWAGPI